jgi:hypothetical protein
MGEMKQKHNLKKFQFKNQRAESLERIRRKMGGKQNWVK